MKRNNSNLSDATVEKNLTEIENKINGKVSINIEKVTGNKVEDIIDLASDPDQLRQVLFNGKKPVQLSVESIISYLSQKLKFRVVLHLGLSVDEPVVLIMPRSAMRDPGKWVFKYLVDYSKMSEDFLNYTSMVFELLLPMLEENATEVLEDKTITETIREICKFVQENDAELKNDPTGSSHFKVEELPDGHGGKVKYYCIRGEEAFKMILGNIRSIFKKKEILTACDCWRGGSLLKKIPDAWITKYTKRILPGGYALDMMISLCRKGGLVMAINLMPWQGGKFRMAGKLNALLNIDHKLYIEPFVGAGGLFFNKTDTGQRKVINDIDVGVYSLWKVLAGGGYQKFCNIFCNLDVSDILFTNYLLQAREGYPGNSEIQKGLIFYYLTVYSFNGNMKSMAYKKYPRMWDKMKLRAVARLRKNIEDAHIRAASAEIYNQDAMEIISKFKDNENALIYIDSPYVYELMGDNKNLYNHSFDNNDQKTMLDLVKDANAKICISGYRGGSLLYEQFLNKDSRWRVLKLGEVTRSAGMYKAKKGDPHNKAGEFVWVNYEVSEYASCRTSIIDFGLTKQEVRYWNENLI